MQQSQMIKMMAQMLVVLYVREEDMNILTLSSFTEAFKRTLTCTHTRRHFKNLAQGGEAIGNSKNRALQRNEHQGCRECNATLVDGRAMIHCGSFHVLVSEMSDLEKSCDSLMTYAKGPQHCSPYSARCTNYIF